MQHLAVTASFEKKSPMDEILNGKSIKADFEAHLVSSLNCDNSLLILTHP